MYPKVLTDQMKNTLLLSQKPKRIISLVPSQTELLFDLGVGDCVVGVTKYCVHPIEKTSKIDKVGGTKKIDMKYIHELQPDLIIGNKEENEKEQINELKNNYLVWMSDIKTLDDAMEMIRQVGELIDELVKAELLIGQIAEAFNNLKTSVSNQPTSSVAYFIWRKPYMVAGKDTFIDTMLNYCGLTNVFRTEQFSRYPEITAQQLQELQPDSIFLSSEPYPFKEQHIEEFKMICPNAKIKIVDGELFSWYGSRLLKAPDYFSTLMSKQ